MMITKNLPYGIIVKYYPGRNDEASIESNFSKGIDLNNTCAEYHSAITVFETMILQHAIAGVDIEGQAYINGVKFVADLLDKQNEYIFGGII